MYIRKALNVFEKVITQITLIGNVSNFLRSMHSEQ